MARTAQAKKVTAPASDVPVDRKARYKDQISEQAPSTVTGKRLKAAYVITQLVLAKYHEVSEEFNTLKKDRDNLNKAIKQAIQENGIACVDNSGDYECELQQVQQADAPDFKILYAVEVGSKIVSDLEAATPGLDHKAALMELVGGDKVVTEIKGKAPEGRKRDYRYLLSLAHGLVECDKLVNNAPKKTVEKLIVKPKKKPVLVKA